MEPDRPPRVVIIDDREADRHDLRQVLERGGIVVAGTRAALHAATGPTVMLVAPHAVASVVADASARVLVLAGGDPGYGLDDALRAGASGFVRRTAPARDLVDVVLAAADGRALRAPATGPVQAAVTQVATMSSFSATAGEPSAR
jgi:DNA-binding NarL/FixJ family response regulator